MSLYILALASVAYSHKLCMKLQINVSQNFYANTFQSPRSERKDEEWRNHLFQRPQRLRGWQPKCSLASRRSSEGQSEFVVQLIRAENIKMALNNSPKLFLYQRASFVTWSKVLRVYLSAQKRKREFHRRLMLAVRKETSLLFLLSKASRSFVYLLFSTAKD